MDENLDKIINLSNDILKKIIVSVADTAQKNNLSLNEIENLFSLVAYQIMFSACAQYKNPREAFDTHTKYVKNLLEKYLDENKSKK